jgi:acetyl esterase/lipase
MHSAVRSLLRGTLAAVLLAVPAGALAQQPVIPVWPGSAPGSESWTRKEVEYTDGGGRKMVRNVVRPTLTAYLPPHDKATGTAVIVAPGGGFTFLSWDSEGVEVAKWLRDHGVAAFVLKYRLVDTGATEEEYQKKVQELFRSIRARNEARPGEVVPLPPDPERDKVIAMAAADGRQAIRVVRKRAAEWGISPGRIGLLGFSAGGAVTMGAVMGHDAESRPNFAAPIYGGSTGGAAVPADAPPLFILVAHDDALVVGSSLKLYSDWRAAGKPAELHVYSKGGHGFGMRKQNLPIDTWIERFGDWLGVQGLLKGER